MIKQEWPTKKRYMYGPIHNVQDIFNEGKKMGVRDTEVRFKCKECSKYCRVSTSNLGYLSSCCSATVNREAKFIR